MNGNIYSPLGLSQDDRSVNAKGWIEFQGAEQSAVLTVTFTQNGVSGSESRTYKRGNKNPMDWDMKVTANDNKRYQRDDTADGHAVAVAKPAGGADWHRNVDLD
jgi:hypothetical protein